jgi:hypothetical protein
MQTISKFTYFTNNIKMNADTVMKQATGIRLEMEEALSKIE